MTIRLFPSLALCWSSDLRPGALVLHGGKQWLSWAQSRASNQGGSVEKNAVTHLINLETFEAVQAFHLESQHVAVVGGAFTWFPDLNEHGSTDEVPPAPGMLVVDAKGVWLFCLTQGRTERFEVSGGGQRMEFGVYRPQPGLMFSGWHLEIRSDDGHILRAGFGTVRSPWVRGGLRAD